MACTMHLNEEKNGIELSFDKKPERVILDEMKALGFRWHHTNKIWYAKQTEERIAFAQKLAEGEFKPIQPMLSRSDLNVGDVFKKPDGVVKFITEVTEDSVSYETLSGLKESFKEEQFAGVLVTDPEEIAVLQKLKEEKTQAAQKDMDEFKAKYGKESSLSNRIADHYTEVGSTPIYQSSDRSLFGVDSCNGFYEDLNVHVKSYSDSFTITELDHAQKKGEECTRYNVSARSYTTDAGLYLANELNIHTVKELVEAVRNDRDMGDLAVYKSEQKGVVTFSPFVEQKPIKTPKKWTKTLFQKALMSGQIYHGVLNQRLTDDYAYDAAYNFGSGRSLDTIATAKDVMESSWGGSTYVHGSEPDKDGVIELSYGDYGTSKTFFYHENCNLAEAKKRVAEIIRSKEKANAELESKRIDVSLESIDANKIYTVSYLEKDFNTDLYEVKTETWQGSRLQYRLQDEMDCSENSDYRMKFTAVEELDIIPDQLYEVGNFHDRLSEAIIDERIIDMGNWKRLVSGKALLELTAEDVHFSKIGDRPISFAQAKSEIAPFISGQSFFMFGPETNYQKALDQLNMEEQRIKQDTKEVQPEVQKQEKAVSAERKPSLFDRISDAEKEKEINREIKAPEQKLKSAAPKFIFDRE